MAILDGHTLKALPPLSCERPLSVARLAQTLTFRARSSGGTTMADPPNDGAPCGQDGATHVTGEGEIVVNKSLTIVLPIHNGEMRLRGCVGELLELASELTPRFAIQIIDDGSTDATYEVAAELAARFPQVTVRRHRHRRGLGAMLEVAHRQCRSEVVIIHDGVTPLDPNQVHKLWSDCVSVPATRTAAGFSGTTYLDDLANLDVDHAAMEQAHARVLGFQLLAPIRDDAERPADSRDTWQVAPSRFEKGPAAQRKSVGQIPRLPRPTFMSALAAFVRGE